MDSKQGLSMQQQLRLRLNLRQMRLGHLLEMSAPEFDEEVRRNLDENPALESVESSDSTSFDADGRPFRETADELMRADYANDDDIPSYRTRDTQSFTADFYDAELADDDTDLATHLLDQLRERSISPRQLDIARHIIGNLDSNGYLRRSTREIADDMSIESGPTDRADVDQVLEIIQQLDPPGIAAQDLPECLLIQIERLPSSPRTEAAEETILQFFDLFAKKKYDRLASALRLSREETDAVVALIRSLNPKPASAFAPAGAAERRTYISPDFIVESDGDGHVSVALAGRHYHLGIDPAFDIDLKAGNPARDFIKARRDEAGEFINLARAREETLLRIMKAIVRHQADFFTDYDRASLRPMVLRDIAAETGYDQSVVSRATTGKYVLTPEGIFPLKMFFSEGIGSDSGTVSQHTVMEALREIVDKENGATPLSDEELANQLTARGFDISRRTVAKYRERMGIPVARLRRK